ncbi:hypothetical protein ACF1BQ_019515 [Bradyrhizobium sp. RDT10]
MNSITTADGPTDFRSSPDQEKIDAIVAALGGDPQFVECKIAPRWGALAQEILAVNMVMAGCRPEYAPIVRAAMLALADREFNLNGVQATTHVASPLIIVNGPLAAEVGMNGGPNAFGSGNRANATIGRAVRLIMLNVGGGWPRISTRAPSAIRASTPTAWPKTKPIVRSPLSRRARLPSRDSTVFAIAAEAPHSVTDHQCNDPEGILDTMCSAMSTIASNSAVLGGHCTVILGLEHAKDIAKAGWTRSDIRHYLWMNSGNAFKAISRDHRYGKVYNRNLPKWLKRDPDTRIPIVPSADNIHLFIMGGHAGRFSAFIPGWGHMNTPVLKAIDPTSAPDDDGCTDGVCAL